MWNYEKRLQYPVKITKTNPKIAQIILTQYGGPDGELGASMRYLSQRYTMPYKEVTGTLTDIGTEELAHLEMICAIVHQLTRDLTPEQLKESGFDQYYVDHTLALWPQAASGTPWSATTFQSKGDPITDLHEDLAAEQKARTTYDNILRLVKDPEVCDPIRRFVFSENVKSYITKDLAKVSESSRITWIVRTSMQLILNLILILNSISQKCPTIPSESIRSLLQNNNESVDHPHSQFL